MEFSLLDYTDGILKYISGKIPRMVIGQRQGSPFRGTNNSVFCLSYNTVIPNTLPSNDQGEDFSSSPMPPILFPDNSLPAASIKP